MVSKKRRIKHCSNRTVQRFNRKIELKPLPDPLPPNAADILRILGAGGVAGNAMAVTGLVKSAVSYWSKWFVNAGALIIDESQIVNTLGLPKKNQCFGPGVPKYYKLTAYGSKLLTGSEECSRLPVVFEDHPVKFPVLRWERVGSIDWEKLGQPRNWVKLGFRVTGVSVVRTSRSVIVHPGPLMGFDVDELEVESGRIVERVRFILEVKFGMQLSDEVVFVHGPMWQVFRPEAREWVKEGGRVKVAGVGSLDASVKPWQKRLSGVAHVEFERKEHAALASVWPPVASDPMKRNASAAVMYPLYLEDIRRVVFDLRGKVDTLTFEVGKSNAIGAQVSGVMVEFERLSDALKNLKMLPEIAVSLLEIVGVLNKLLGLDNNSQVKASEVPKGSGGSEYVS